MIPTTKPIKQPMKVPTTARSKVTPAPVSKTEPYSSIRKYTQPKKVVGITIAPYFNYNIIIVEKGDECVALILNLYQIIEPKVVF